jgi:hypothetical protein
MRNIDPSRMCITVLKIDANNEPTDPETPRNKDLKYDREKRTRTRVEFGPIVKAYLFIIFC